MSDLTLEPDGPGKLVGAGATLRTENAALRAELLERTRDCLRHVENERTRLQREDVSCVALSVEYSSLLDRIVELEAANPTSSPDSGDCGAEAEDA